MKKILFPILFLTSLFAFVSCNDDEPGEPIYVSIGTLQKPGTQYVIDFDEDPTCLVPDSSLLVYNKLNKPGQRLIASYNYISNGRGQESIFLQDVRGVLTKELTAKPATPEEDKKLGYNELRIDRAWLGGGFLNVKFYYLSDGISGNPHLITAYNTGETDKDGYQIIEMRHNANGHQPYFVSYPSYVSFAIPYTEDNKPQLKLRYYYNGNVQRLVTVKEK